MRSQPNFCSLAAQAEALLRKLQREGEAPPENGMEAGAVGGVERRAHCSARCVSPELETSVSPGRTDQEQDEEASSDDDSGCENSMDQSGILDFSASAIAEQLTRMDAVRGRICFEFSARSSCCPKC